MDLEKRILIRTEKIYSSAPDESNKSMAQLSKGMTTLQDGGTIWEYSGSF